MVLLGSWGRGGPAGDGPGWEPLAEPLPWDTPRSGGCKGTGGSLAVLARIFYF